MHIRHYVNPRSLCPRNFSKLCRQTAALPQPWPNYLRLCQRLFDFIWTSVNLTNRACQCLRTYAWPRRQNNQSLGHSSLYFHFQGYQFTFKVSFLKEIKSFLYFHFFVDINEYRITLGSLFPWNHLILQLLNYLLLFNYFIN